MQEILTMKTGAVQNSPPDKSKPEPGPWSPVCSLSQFSPQSSMICGSVTVPFTHRFPNVGDMPVFYLILGQLKVIKLELLNTLNFKF